MKTFPQRLRFWTALVLATYLVAFNVAPAAAGLAPSTASGTTAIASERSADLLIVQRALENKVVARKLLDYGVAPADVQLRLASMSDQEVHTLASASKGLPSGGDGTGTIIGLLIIVILVIVIMKLLNKEIVVR